ncbi:MAG: four-carbon acid sugar kinase family protein [Alphaproteobacteria bacterium]
MGIVLGCVADDFTGATDLANTLVKQGMRTVQVLGVPDEATDVGDAEAVVVAIKSRTAPVADAVDWSLESLAWLRQRGAKQFFFKYCSTFDSTDQGNIGPVADALLEALGGDFTIACPAFPTTGRTIYKGHLFVGDVLLSDSSMKDHPLTPMRDASLVRVLGRQTPHKVGLVEYATVTQGADSVRAAYARLAADGHRHAIVDAITDADLTTIGAASSALTLITGGSGIALGLPANYRGAGLIGEAAPAELPRPTGRGAVLAGSCSVATRGQVAAVADKWPTRHIDPFELHRDKDTVAALLDWAASQPADTPILIASSDAPENVGKVQAELGREAAGALVENAFGELAKGLVDMGVRQLIVAGGETSGAAISALDVPALRIGPEIDPGVPWCESLGEPALALALKSGNFGDKDFFAKAFGMLR